jgi:hypothetical protein
LGFLLFFGGFLGYKFGLSFLKKAIKAEKRQKNQRKGKKKAKELAANDQSIPNRSNFSTFIDPNFKNILKKKRKILLNFLNTTSINFFRPLLETDLKNKKQTLFDHLLNNKKRIPKTHRISSWFVDLQHRHMAGLPCAFAWGS